jgi:hypothetical protein
VIELEGGSDGGFSASKATARTGREKIGMSLTFGSEADDLRLVCRNANAVV